MNPTSSPDSPTATGACTFSAPTISRFTLPTSTMSRDVEGLGVRHPLAVAELGRLAEALHQRADLGTTAVHDNGEHADAPHQNDVHREPVEDRLRPEVGVAERAAAELHDDDRARKAPDVRDRLGEGRRGPRRVPVGGGAHDVLMFSSM